VRRDGLSPEAERDLNDVKADLVKEAGVRIARQVLREIRDALRFLADTPGAGHSREDLTDAAVKFRPVFSYPIVYDPAKHPLEIVRVLHGRRDIASSLDMDGA
jgi:antitoxin ParD1/3/4/toxin ParE1/3/4